MVARNGGGLARRAGAAEGQVACLQALEPRMLLALTFETFSPEGFATGTVDESVELVNSSGSNRDWELWAQYEDDSRAPALVASGQLASGERSSVRIVDDQNLAGALVALDEPYALVLRSDDDAIKAVLYHDDFGGRTGEHFTTTSGTSFAIAELEKDDSSRDFVVLYNPSSSAATVVLTLEDSTGATFDFAKRVEPGRRAGWSIGNMPTLPQGVYAARLVSDVPIVVAGTRYDLVNQAAVLEVLSQGPGATAGAILAAEFFDNSSNGFNLITLYNPGQTSADVTLHFLTRDNAPLSGPAQVTYTVEAGRTRVVSLAATGHAANDELGVVYESTQPIAAKFVSRKQGALVLGRAQVVAATEYFFPQGRLDKLRAGDVRTEDVFLFNPTNQSMSATVTWTFSNGMVVSETKNLDPLEFEDVDARLNIPLPIGGLRYTARVVATGTVVASLSPWDGGGVSSPATYLGVPSGTVRPLSEVLVI